MTNTNLHLNADIEGTIEKAINNQIAKIGRYDESREVKRFSTFIQAFDYALILYTEMVSNGNIKHRE